MSAIRPSMIALVSTRIRGHGRRSPSARPRADEAHRLRRGDQVVPLGDGQADHRRARGRSRCRAARRSRSAPAGWTAAGRAAGPAGGPRNSPMIAVTNSAVDSCWTARSAASAGITVRYGSSVKPSTIQATTHADDEQRRARRGLEDRQLRDDEGDPDEPAEGGSQEADGSDHVGLEWPRSAGRRRSPVVDGRRSIVGARQPSTRVPASTVTGRRSGASSRSPVGPAGRRAPRRASPRARRGGSRPARRRCPATSGGAPPRPAGTIARSNPSRAASRSRRSSPATGRSSPSRPTSPTATVRGVDRAVAQRGGEGQRDGEIEAGLGDAQAAGEIRVDVVAAEADAGAPAEHREQQREPRRVDARGAPRRRRVAGRRDQRLDLDEQRPAALDRRRDDAAGRGAVVLGEEGPARDRRPRAARTRPSRRRRARRSSRSGSSRRGRGASRRRARRRGR